MPSHQNQDNHDDRSSLCHRLGDILVEDFSEEDFPDGFTVDDLLRHPDIYKEDYEEIRWNDLFGGVAYGFGNGAWCRLRKKDPAEKMKKWEVVDEREIMKHWLENLRKNLELESNSVIHPTDTGFLRRLDEADFEIRGGLDFENSLSIDKDRKREPRTDSLYRKAAKIIADRLPRPCPLTAANVSRILSCIDSARQDEIHRKESEELGDFPPLCEAAWNEDADKVRRLLMDGAFVDEIAPVEELRALDYAAIRGNLEIVRILVEAGADVTARNPQGDTVMHAAMESGYLELTRYLIEHGADAAAPDDSGATPLQIAAFGAGPELIEYLIENGADVNAGTKFTALDNAMMAGNRKIFRILKKHGGKYGMDILLDEG